MSRRKVPTEALPFPVLVRTQMTGFEDAHVGISVVNFANVGSHGG